MHLEDAPDSAYPSRKSARWVDADYSQSRSYFLTAATHNRQHLFGTVVFDKVQLSPQGFAVQQTFQDLLVKFPSIELESFVVMPNHIHLIASIHIDGSVSIPKIMQWFKTQTTNRIIRGVKEAGWPAFDSKVWQRSYHDRIIRDRDEHERIARYILENPKLWNQDVFY